MPDDNPIESIEGAGPDHGVVVPLRPSAVSGTRRPFLLLQGPVGPFFKDLAAAFMEAGHSIDRVRFNAADRLHAGPVADRTSARMLDYDQGFDLFAPWLRGLCWRNHYAGIVMFGGERPAHRVAREIAREFGIPVISLEEGYIRSGYVAVERGGNNSRSPYAGRLPEPGLAFLNAEGVEAKGFRWMIWWAFLGFTSRNVRSFLREKRFDHKRRPTVSEGFYWLRSATRWLRGTGLSEKRARALGSFDLVPLQVPDDAQLGEAACGWTNDALIAATIESFARHAPRDRHLVFKVHPLERGHTRDHKKIASLARRWGVSARVHCMMTGSLGNMAHAARSMITINSTSGFSALHAGKPLLVLGYAIYRHPDLAHCGGDRESIDEFWTATRAAPTGLAARFEQWLKAVALVPGDFYDPTVAEETAKAIAQRAIELAEHGEVRLPQVADASGREGIQAAS